MEKIMEKITKFEANIEGAAPLLMNKLDRDLNLEFKEVARDKRDEWLDANWERKLYTKVIDGKKQIIFPEDVVHSFLWNAAMKYRVPPPREVGRTWTAYFKAGVIIDEPAVLECSKPVPFCTMVNGNPSSAKKSSKVYSVRPMINEWKTTLKFSDMGERLDRKTIESILVAGGLFVGLGDWRPQRGRFKLRDLKMETIQV